MLSLYEPVAARTGEYQVRNTTGVSSNEQVRVTERYSQDIVDFL
jgi:hypothetical protein